MPDDGFLYRMGGQVYSYDALKTGSEAELTELSALQGTNLTFDDDLIESVHTGTIETVYEDDDGQRRRSAQYRYRDRVVT